MTLEHCIVLDDKGFALVGEPGDLLQKAVDLGVLYVCERDDGTCPLGQHRGGAFLHYMPGKTEVDYDGVEE